MVQHEVCIGCRYNNYPECLGTIMDDGNPMNIENLRSGFQCGQKNEPEMMDFSIKIKSDLELKLEELEAKIKVLKDEQE
jgi:glycine cleavage system regulatory protein